MAVTVCSNGGDSMRLKMGHAASRFEPSAADFHPPSLKKDVPLSQSITVILPTKNVADFLVRRVREILEVVSEFTDKVELLIVDDESTDGTPDIANEQGIPG